MAKNENKIKPQNEKAAELKKASDASEGEKVAGFNSSAFKSSDEPKTEVKKDSDEPNSNKLPKEPTYEASRFKNPSGIDESVPAKYRKFQ